MWVLIQFSIPTVGDFSKGTVAIGTIFRPAISNHLVSDNAEGDVHFFAAFSALYC
jgi:hypothetical protein